MFPFGPPRSYVEPSLNIETIKYGHEYPRVEAGKNTSTVIPASRKRRRKGNPVVLD
jgi:hypothetical protein